MTPPSVDPLVIDPLSEQIDLLAMTIRDIGPLVVAFSGGVDSALLTVAALNELGPDGVLAVTADSASLGSGELDHCRALA
ncbi:MAG: hypothetical protein GY939_21820, partial [Actinomycetia bacterium]|nr:hypothetical protein [Actinomycetes bacterium]